MDVEYITDSVGKAAVAASVLLSIIGYSSTVIKTLRTGEHMSTTHASLALLASALWCVYGALKRDPYLPVSEGIAVILTTTIIVIKIRDIIKKRRQ